MASLPSRVPTNPTRCDNIFIPTCILRTRRPRGRSRETRWGIVQREHRVVRPDGTERVVLQQGETTNEDGRPVQLVGTCLDITERKRAEREREDSLRWMRAVLEQSPVGLILVHGPRGERVEANSRAQKMGSGPIADIAHYSQHVCAPDGRPRAPGTFRPSAHSEASTWRTRSFFSSARMATRFRSQCSRTDCRFRLGRLGGPSSPSRTSAPRRNSNACVRSGAPSWRTSYDSRSGRSPSTHRRSRAPTQDSRLHKFIDKRHPVGRPSP